MSVNPPEPQTVRTEDPASGGASPRPGDDLHVTGVCHIMFAFDLGFKLDLVEAERRLTVQAERSMVSRRRRAPSWFQYEPPPLRLPLPSTPVQIGRFTTEPQVQCTLFDFGATSIAYRIPLEGPLRELPTLSEALYDNEELSASAQKDLDALLELLGPDAWERPVPDVAEDYTVFAFSQWDSDAPPEDLIDRHREDLAALLTAETEPLAEQQVRDCLSSRLSYGPNDLTIAHWNGAILLDTAPDDVLTLLEHANVELMELRCLDRQLDDLLERSRAMMTRQSRYSIWPLTLGSRDVRRLAEAQTNSALMFEGMNNAIKLVGDQYLARLYRLVSEKLHMPAWDANVLRKLQVAESIFEKITHRQTTRRMEVLEVIIILLILIEVIRPFVPWLAG